MPSLGEFFIEVSFGISEVPTQKAEADRILDNLKENLKGKGNDIEQSAKAVGYGLGTVTAGLTKLFGAYLTFEGFKSLVKGVVDSATELWNLSQLTGEAPDTLNRWYYTAEGFGESGKGALGLITNLKDALIQLSLVSPGAPGTGTDNPMLRGLSIILGGPAGLQGRKPTELLLEARKKLLEMVEQYGRSRVLGWLQGFGFGALRFTLTGPDEQFRKLYDEMLKLETEAVKSAAELKQPIANLESAWNTLKINLIETLAPALTAVIDLMNKLLTVVDRVLEKTNAIDHAANERKHLKKVEEGLNRNYGPKSSGERKDILGTPDPAPPVQEPQTPRQATHGQIGGGGGASSGGANASPANPPETPPAPTPEATPPVPSADQPGGPFDFPSQSSMPPVPATNQPGGPFDFPKEQISTGDQAWLDALKGPQFDNALELGSKSKKPKPLRDVPKMPSAKPAPPPPPKAPPPPPPPPPPPEPPNPYDRYVGRTFGEVAAELAQRKYGFAPRSMVDARLRDNGIDPNAPITKQWLRSPQGRAATKGLEDQGLVPPGGPQSLRNLEGMQVLPAALRTETAQPNIPGPGARATFSAPIEHHDDTETHIGNLVVNTNATDAEGIARDIHLALAENKRPSLKEAYDKFHESPVPPESPQLRRLRGEDSGVSAPRPSSGDRGSTERLMQRLNEYNAETPPLANNAARRNLGLPEIERSQDAMSGSPFNAAGVRGLEGTPSGAMAPGAPPPRSGPQSVAAGRAQEMAGGYLRAGSTGMGVRKLQAEMGVTPTGRFDHRTQIAVRQFQRHHGLNPDGIVGPKTLAALQQKRVPRSDVGTTGP